MIRPKLITALGDPGIYIGEQEYTSGPGTYYFEVPQAVRRIHAVCIGAGAQGGDDGDNAGSDAWAGGGGGGLGWKNNIEVEPGEVLVVQVGAVVGEGEAQSAAGHSWIKRMAEPETFIEGSMGEPEGEPLVAGYAPGGFSPQSGGDFLGDGGGQGGFGSSNTTYTGNDGNPYVKSKGSGGGAGGYTGRGGRGCTNNGDPTQDGGGGSGGASRVAYQSGSRGGYRGGGTGVKGKGASGASRRPESLDFDAESNGGPGYPGSGGDGKLFGAGGSGERDGWNGQDDTRAGHGAVRIIWGNRFSYPDNADVEAE